MKSLVLVALALVLVAGGGATLALAASICLYNNNGNQTSTQTTRGVTPTARPSPTPTATPTVYYMAHFFVVMNGDLENGDTVGNYININNNTYEAREASGGDLYQNGTADMLGRAAGIAQVVSDNTGAASFVVLVDRIDTYQDAQKYFQRQVGLIQGQPKSENIGEESAAGMVQVKGQQTYQLFVRDVNIIITVATVPANTAQDMGDYFVKIVQAIIPRGQACTYSTDGTITLLPGNDSNACK
jgi:hypothetical protein